MRRNNLIILLIALVTSFPFMNAQAQDHYAHFRLVNFLEAPTAELSVTNLENGQQKVIKMDYGESINYIKLTPQHYRFSLIIKNKKVLEKEFVMGAKGFYTLVIAGMLSDKIETNQQTTLFKLKKLLGGETKDDNNFLPQWYMLRDNYDGSTSAAYVRFVNINPSSTLLSLKKEESKLFEEIPYPHVTDIKKIKEGNHTYRVSKGDITVSEFKLTTTAGHIYTLVTGANLNNAKQLETIILENKAKYLLTP
ncbi:DUF4397 domain-containing protein [Fulvivirga sediminis]|uniref:DUF4397 domain-containing protein n=1 Tax=Fulvivirga sediminis TaxID=2803949 RepID=A0A937F9G9_9BACT|nr:DUF4397 domain-containing protein [Fulvivirga sediminis]MBL3658160.1 DUF4397 domain-containing protein [Fulvivirga sediminis]